MPLVAQTRISVPEDERSETQAKSPTANARRYVDIGGVSAKRTIFRPPSVATDSSGMFEMAARCPGTTIVTEKVALSDGSSQQGNARRASVGSNCVDARWRSLPSPST